MIGEVLTISCVGNMLSTFGKTKWFTINDRLGLILSLNHMRGHDITDIMLTTWLK